jgi:hypothetical protein
MYRAWRRSLTVERSADCASTLDSTAVSSDEPLLRVFAGRAAALTARATRAKVT